MHDGFTFTFTLHRAQAQRDTIRQNYNYNYNALWILTLTDRAEADARGRREARYDHTDKQATQGWNYTHTGYSRPQGRPSWPSRKCMGRGDAGGADALAQDKMHAKRESERDVCVCIYIRAIYTYMCMCV